MLYWSKIALKAPKSDSKPLCFRTPRRTKRAAVGRSKAIGYDKAGHPVYGEVITSKKG